MGQIMKSLGLVCQLISRRANARLDFIHRQKSADDSCRADEHLFGLAAGCLGRDFGHATGIFQSLFAGAGISVAGANDHAAGIGSRHTLSGDFDRCGRYAVLREHPGRSRGMVAHHQPQIKLAPVGLDSAMNASKAIAARQNQVLRSHVEGPGCGRARLSPSRQPRVEWLGGSLASRCKAIIPAVSKEFAVALRRWYVSRGVGIRLDIIGLIQGGRGMFGVYLAGIVFAVEENAPPSLGREALGIGWAVIYTVVGGIIGIALVLGASFLLPYLINRLTPDIDEE